MYGPLVLSTIVVGIILLVTGSALFAYALYRRTRVSLLSLAALLRSLLYYYYLSIIYFHFVYITHWCATFKYCGKQKTLGLLCRRMLGQNLHVRNDSIGICAVNLALF